MTDGGSRRCGKVHSFLRHGHRSSPTAFLPPFSLRRRIIGCVCALLAVPFGACLSARLSPRYHGKVHTRSIPVGRFYSVVKEQEGKRSPHFYSRKKRRFCKKVMKIFKLFLFCPSLPLAKALSFVIKPSYFFSCSSFLPPQFHWTNHC